jgi:hypothetical protein
MKVILTREDARRLGRLMEEKPDLIGVDVTEVETADTPVGEGEPAIVMTAGTSFHCRVQETPDPARVVIEDLDGRRVLDNTEALG